MSLSERVQAINKQIAALREERDAILFPFEETNKRAVHAVLNTISDSVRKWSCFYEHWFLDPHVHPEPEPHAYLLEPLGFQKIASNTVESSIDVWAPTESSS